MQRRSFMLALAGAAATPRLALAQERRLSVVTGGTGGVYYPLGGGLANLLTRHVPGWQVTAEVTGGSVDNLRLVGARRADIGFTMADASLDAARKAVRGFRVMSRTTSRRARNAWPPLSKSKQPSRSRSTRTC